MVKKSIFGGTYIFYGGVYFFSFCETLRSPKAYNLKAKIYTKLDEVWTKTIWFGFLVKIEVMKSMDKSSILIIINQAS